jgi:pimeloyl-ACP methyl ester carboxylesterase
MSAAAQSERWQMLPRELPLPPLTSTGHVARGDARIWYATLGQGAPVILLHGGKGSSDNWGNQVPALLASGRRVILIDSRGHGRSTPGTAPLHYEAMAEDVVAVMDALGLGRAALVGWSDGANLGLIVAMRHPQRTTCIFAFGANMRTDVIVPGAFANPILAVAAERLVADYVRLSPAPGQFADLKRRLDHMQQSEPDYDAAALQAIAGVPVAIVCGDHDEFVQRSHTEFLAACIPATRLIVLPDTSHFAPWQAPDDFNRAMLAFLDRAEDDARP